MVDGMVGNWSRRRFKTLNSKLPRNCIAGLIPFSVKPVIEILGKPIPALPVRLLPERCLKFALSRFDRGR